MISINQNLDSLFLVDLFLGERENKVTIGHAENVVHVVKLDWDHGTATGRLHLSLFHIIFTKLRCLFHGSIKTIWFVTWQLVTISLLPSNKLEGNWRPGYQSF